MLKRRRSLREIASRRSLAMTGIALAMTGIALAMTGIALAMTGIALAMTDYFTSIIRRVVTWPPDVSA